MQEKQIIYAADYRAPDLENKRDEGGDGELQRRADGPERLHDVIEVWSRGDVIHRRIF